MSSNRANASARKRRAGEPVGQQQQNQRMQQQSGRGVVAGVQEPLQPP